MVDGSFLTRDSLQTILREFEIIPAVHRPTVWKAVLELPGNKDEFLNLRRLGKKSEIFVDLRHIENDHLRKITTRVTQSLFVHSPSLVPFNDFICAFVSAFTTVLGANELIYFEIMLTVLANYCQHWFDHSPQPPYSLMSLMDIILMKTEPILYRHMALRGIRSIDYAWDWMSKAFQTITYQEEWPILWDHILCNSPSLVSFLPLAACKIHAKHLLQCETHEEIEDFLRKIAPVDVQTLLQETYRLLESTCADIHPGSNMHGFRPLPRGKYPTLNTNDVIKYVSELGSSDNMANLLENAKEVDAEIEQVLLEGLALRRQLTGM